MANHALVPITPLTVTEEFNNSMDPEMMVEDPEWKLEELVQAPVAHGSNILLPTEITEEEHEWIETQRFTSNEQIKEISPDCQISLEKIKKLEEEMLWLEFELDDKEEEEAQNKIEIQQAKMNLKEQEYEQKLKMIALNKNLCKDKIESLKTELNSVKATIESCLNKVENDKTKNAALELECSCLKWALNEKSEMCHKLENQLIQAHKKLEEDQEAIIQNSLQISKINMLENELQCSICSELFIKAMTLSCSHSFCDYCINEWKKTRGECPLCKKTITSVVPSIALDNFILEFTATLSPRHQEERKKVTNKRKC